MVALTYDVQWSSPESVHPESAAPTDNLRGSPQIQTVEKPLESSRGSQPSRTFNRAQRRVRWARGDFCAGKSHFPEQKSFPCSFCARKSLRFQQKLVRVAVAGELASPSTSLSKPFLTSWVGVADYAAAAGQHTIPATINWSGWGLRSAGPTATGCRRFYRRIREA